MIMVLKSSLVFGHPHTKAKVEAPMKILDEIRAYNGKLNYIELVELVTRINNRVNTQVNQGTGRIPLMYYNKEKAFNTLYHQSTLIRLSHYKYMMVIYMCIVTQNS